jgi:hypothetical protein
MAARGLQDQQKNMKEADRYQQLVQEKEEKELLNAESHEHSIQEADEAVPREVQGARAAGARQGRVSPRQRVPQRRLSPGAARVTSAAPSHSRWFARGWKTAARCSTRWTTPSRRSWTMKGCKPEPEL